MKPTTQVYSSTRSLSYKRSIVRWQGAICVRRMIENAIALRLAIFLILCYGLRSFHRPSV